MKHFRLMLALAVLSVGAGCTHAVSEVETGKFAPATQGRSTGSIEVVERGWAPTTFEDEIPNFPIQLSDVPTGQRSGGPIALKIRDRRPETPVPPEVMEQMREDSLRLPISANVQLATESTTELTGTSANVADGIDASESCIDCATVPPDPEIAAGPNHLIIVSNVAFAIYDKATGARIAGPIDFDQFFNGTGCVGTFDPNVLYDESTDRFILGVDGDGVRYCVAASQTADPTGAWNRYSFQTISKRNEFFDYPHAGVGVEAIFMGANIFRSVFFADARVWAINKSRLYNGQSLQVVGKTTGSDSTPQPMNLKGWNQGTWPASATQYILTDDQYNGATYGVWSWSNPFGANGGTLTKTGVVDLNAATGVVAGQAIDAQQLGGNDIQGNDWRVQDADYRNGYLWMTTTIACNPGGGSVNCVRWAQIDPVAVSVVQAGVFGSSGEHRTFADVAANHCNDAAIGYTKTSANMHPSVFVTGRQAADPAGTLQAEVVCRNGDGTYTSFDSAPHRWGDYSEMTVDPNGVDFWYVGEYSKTPQADPSFTTALWGTTICKVTFPCTAP